MSIGGSGKIGGGMSMPPSSLSSTASQPKPAASSSLPKTAGQVKDTFENALSKQGLDKSGASMRSVAQLSINGESRLQDVLKASRTNPALIKSYRTALNGANRHTQAELTKLQAQMATHLKAMAGADVPEELLASIGEQMDVLRRRMSELRRRFNANRRRLKALSTIAGRLDEGLPDEEFATLLGNLKAVEDALEKKKRGLVMSEEFYSNRDDTPEHLRGVVRVPMADDSDNKGDELASRHPLHTITDMAAGMMDPQLSTDVHAADEHGPAVTSDDDAFFQLRKELLPG